MAVIDEAANLLTQRSDNCLTVSAKCNTYGYVTVRWGKRTTYLHRLVYEVCFGVIPCGLEVMHVCDNRACINPNHLTVGTHAENIADAARKNRMAHKLTIADVKEVRRLCSAGMRQVDVAALFGIGQDHVSRIKNRRRRTHIS